MLSKIDVEKFYTLLEINFRLNLKYKDIYSLVSQIIESAARISDAEIASVLLTGEEGNELFYETRASTRSTSTESKGKVKKYSVKSVDKSIGSIAERVINNNKSVIVNDAAVNKLRPSVSGRQINYICKTAMAVPIKLKDECTGVIEVINKRGKEGFTQEDIEWLEIYAVQAAVAIAGARNMEETRSETNQLENDQGFNKIIVKSPAVLEILDVIDRAAKANSSVLILGESGVGKELFAEQVHLRSRRSRSPFIRVNCAALPDGLLESELFGHVKGAFTSAVSSRQGRFEMADGGTIFLDEIGDLPLPLQAKILRVIQERKFEKVGSDVTVSVNVRIVAATNKDLEQQVQNGRFREDLYYRLNVLPIYIPPLRRRPEDIVELSQFFLENYMRETKKQFAGFSRDAQEAMLSYSWPGNVRELQNCIERACVTGRNKRIEREDLFPGTTGQSFTAGKGAAQRNLKTAVNIFKAGFIRKVLEENQWNQTEAARALAIQRTYLSRLIKELNIEQSKSGN